MQHTSTARTAFVCLLSAAAFATHAQKAAAPTPAPAPAASAASAPLNKNLPSQRTPAEVRNSATTPGDLRPENPVVPQISVPLGRAEKTPVLSPKEAQAKQASKAAQSDGETPASCLAKVKVEDRESCMSRVHSTNAGSGSKPKAP